MFLLLIVSYFGYSLAVKLPGIYLSALSKHIPQTELSVSIEEIAVRVNELTEKSKELSDYYRRVAPKQERLQKKLTRHCGNNEQCLRACGFLMDALELGYRERAFPNDLSVQHKSLEWGILENMQQIRASEFSNIVFHSYHHHHEKVSYLQRVLEYNSRYLRLYHNLTPRPHFDTVIGLVGERHEVVLRQLIQKSSQYYMNRLYQTSGHVYPRLVAETTLAYYHSYMWYMFMSRHLPTPVTSLRSLENSFIRRVDGMLTAHLESHFHLSMRSYYTLVTDLLYAHQRLLEFSYYKLSGVERVQYLGLEEDLLSLYSKMEKLFLDVGQSLIASTVHFHTLDMKQSVELNMDSCTHMINKVEIYLVNYVLDNEPGVTIRISESNVNIDEFTLNVFLLGLSSQLAISSEDMSKEIHNITSLTRTFTEDSLQALLKERFSKLFKKSETRFYTKFVEGSDLENN